MIDRHGGKPVLIVGFALFAAGIAGIAFAIQANSVWWRQAQAVEACASTSSVNSSEGFFQL